MHERGVVPRAAREPIALLSTLVARALGLAAGVALALLAAAFFWLP
jgi:hypothetical protein